MADAMAIISDDGRGNHRDHTVPTIDNYSSWPGRTNSQSMLRYDTKMALQKCNEQIAVIQMPDWQMLDNTRQDGHGYRRVRQAIAMTVFRIRQ